jgi:hypothetical protein
MSSTPRSRPRRLPSDAAVAAPRDGAAAAVALRRVVAEPRDGAARGAAAVAAAVAVAVAVALRRVVAAGRRDEAVLRGAATGERRASRATDGARGVGGA